MRQFGAAAGFACVVFFDTIARNTTFQNKPPFSGGLYFYLPILYIQTASGRCKPEKSFMQKIPLTVRGAELLKEELQQLKSVARPQVIEAIAEARSHGDLSENAEYEAAKERQGFIEGRIAEVEHKLSMAHIINPAEIHAEGKVVFGATVTLEDLDTEEQVRYQIVGEDEADIKANKIYVGSPIARALIGKEEGDTAEVQAPGGIREYDIVAVEYI